jgi:translation initiation factor 1 (eIF-1/SUI1)
MLGIDAQWKKHCPQTSIAHSVAEHKEPYEQQAATKRQHIVAVYPRLTLVTCRSCESAALLLIMSSNLACAGPSKEDVVEIQTEEQGLIKFINILSETGLCGMKCTSLQGMHLPSSAPGR